MLFSNKKYKLNDYEYLEFKLLNRVNIDVQKKEITRAINRIEGHMVTKATNQNLKNKLGELYLREGEYAKAGKHFYFKVIKTSEEIEAVNIFKKKYGNDPTIILKNLISKESFKVTDLSLFAKKKINLLITQINKEQNIIPNFLKGIKAHLDKVLPS